MDDNANERKPASRAYFRQTVCARNSKAPLYSYMERFQPDRTSGIPWTALGAVRDPRHCLRKHSSRERETIAAKSARDRSQARRDSLIRGATAMIRRKRRAPCYKILNVRGGACNRLISLLSLKQEIFTFQDPISSQDCFEQRKPPGTR